MYKVCIFAGTTEGRELACLLTEKGVRVHACVATEYGGTLLEESENLTVSARRLTAEEMEALLGSESFDCVVDATHPYAPIVTDNIRTACARTGTEYLRLLRQQGENRECLYAADTAEAVSMLRELPGNILLTTGSKEIAAYAALPDFGERVYARVLPVESSIAACREQGLPASRILAMQGPFTLEMNLAMIRMVNAAALVTKDSGDKGGFMEKCEAARLAGIPVLVIGRPRQVAGQSFGEIAKLLSQRYGFSVAGRVSIVGIGPGDRENRTLRADRAIREADCIIGAKRMLDAVALPGQHRCEAIAPEKIMDAIRSNPQCRRFAVVMAGDIGFYSGTKKLLPLLTDYQVELIPGLSSLVCLCARLGVSYEDVTCVSLHGRDNDIVSAVSRNGKVFALVGGEDGMKNLCADLTAAGLGDARVAVGERLGYADEKITQGTAAELAEGYFNSLSVALITRRPDAVVTHGLADSTFRRGEHADGSAVPMTKREIRAVALSRLELTRDAVCWDIGAGTGSVSIEMAMQADRGHVYAVEKKEAALELLRENAEKLHIKNMTVISGSAPECCGELPAPTHVFIGGSSGNLARILELAREKNPGVRIVATAIALETVAELTRCAKASGKDSELICVTAAVSKKAGPYTLMQGQNPVYIGVLG